MLAQQWVADLNAAASAYLRERHLTPIVKVTFVDGDTRYVQKVEAGPSDRLITLHVYPDANDVLGNMVRVERLSPEQGAEYLTRVAILVEPERVMKVELLHEQPQGRAVGFAVPDA